MFNIDLLAETFGWLAFGIGIMAFQFKAGRSIIFTQIPSNIFYVLHLSMIGATAGAITSACLIFRNTLALFLPEQHLKHLILLMTPIVLLLVLTFSENTYGMLAAFGNIIMGLSLIYRENSIKLRSMQFIAQIFFISYGILSGSLPLALMGGMSMTSNTIGAFRYEDVFTPLRLKVSRAFQAL